MLIPDAFLGPDDIPECHGERRRVLLVCPPFQALSLSSLAVAQLATVLRSQGIECSEAYLHFDFARLVGKNTYNNVRDIRSGLTAELLFVEGLHGTPQDPQAERQLTALYGPSEARAVLRQQLADRCLSSVDQSKPDLVGFTTSFSQLMASLWLTHVIKQKFPEMFVVLGGAACSEPMGTQVLSAYPQVDRAISGFGEGPLLQLALRKESQDRLIHSNEPLSLDSLPVPDYTSFFEQAGEFADDAELLVTFESSRGCWWGQKNQCMFCGLNGVEIHFTSKSSRRVVSEVRELWDRHGRNLYATDTILSREHLRSAIVELGQFEQGPHLFYECKANLSEADVVALRRARVRNIQPGIESLNSHVLGLLRKGVTAIRNLALLKWCAERGISVLWNLLCVIPGETFGDYDQQILLFDRIPHFQPPDAVKAVRIDRYSPFFKEYRNFGWQRLQPFPEYRWLHPHLDAAALQDIAYHFDGVGGIQPGPYLKRLHTAVADWKERFKQADGLFLSPEKGLVRHESGHGFQYSRSPILEKIIDLTHEIVTVEHVLNAAQCGIGQLEQLVKANILYREGDKVLNLTVRTHPPSLQ